jgi:hypothetical protein
VVVDHHPALGYRQPGPRLVVGVAALGRLAQARVELGDQLADGAGLVGLAVVPGVVDLQEDPLRPPVVGRVGGDDRAPLVVAQAQAPQLAPHVDHVGLGGDTGVLAVLDRVLLGGEAEGVEAHAVQHVVALHAHVAGVDVGADVAQWVPDVEPGAARVGEHVEHVELGAVPQLLEALAQVADRVGGVERALLLPARLPPRLDLLGERGRVAVGGGVGCGGSRSPALVGIGHGDRQYRLGVTVKSSEALLGPLGRRRGGWYGVTVEDCPAGGSRKPPL